MGDEENIYVDASQPATLHDGPVHTDYFTLPEARIAWDRLPPVRQQTATISSDGKVYTVQEINRLHYGPKPSAEYGTDPAVADATTSPPQARIPFSVDSSEIAQTVYAAARRNMALNMSGSVEPVVPPENAAVSASTAPAAGTAPAGLATEIQSITRANSGATVDVPAIGPLETSRGMPRVQANAARAAGQTLTVTFADEEAVKGWLNKQSDDVVVVFAARAALRVIPVAPQTTSDAARRVVLRVFRAVATAWAVAAYPGHRRELNNTARAALRGLGDVAAPPLIRAAAYAAATATGEPGAVSRSSTAVLYALEAARSNGVEALKSLLDALAVDAGLLGQRLDPVTLANSKLWPEPIPEWAHRKWEELSGGLHAANENWEVWTNWYEERLDGQPKNQNAEVARVTIDNSIWEKGPSALNVHIRDLLEEHGIFQYALADDLESPPTVDAIPRQTTAASQFAVDTEGRLDLVPDAPLPMECSAKSIRRCVIKL